MYKLIKWVLDRILSLLAGILFFPFFILIGLIIKCTSKGPILFKQKRVGKNKKLFNIWKFRTMNIDAPHDMPTHLLESSDKYITKFGKFLRKTSIDELPQLWDLFVGRLSIVGPRSPIYEETLEYTNYQKQRLLVKGGLLCLWQIKHDRHHIHFDDWVKLDLEYIEKRSLWLDFKIIVKGACMVLFDHTGE